MWARLSIAALLLLNPINAFAPNGYRAGAKNSYFVNTSPFSRNACTVQMAADFYNTLGVDRGADEKAIKSAYRQMAKKYHPGK